MSDTQTILFGIGVLFIAVVIPVFLIIKYIKPKMFEYVKSHAEGKDKKTDFIKNRKLNIIAGVILILLFGYNFISESSIISLILVFFIFIRTLNYISPSLIWIIGKYVVLPIIGIWLLICLFNWIKGDNWTLMICEGELMMDGGCYNNSYVLEGYSSQRACMEKGLTIPNITGFECGKNCRMDATWGRVCNQLCNKTGCHD